MKHRMSRLQRAKQFMPFAALKGFEVLLAAVARPKENRVELSEDQIEELNRTIQSLAIGKPAHSLFIEGVAIAFKDIKEINLFE
ncbi:MAG: hypothetical protein E7G82_08385 [Veillonella sp.]|nr:hypothetical protein [Veillonella sp.]